MTKGKSVQKKEVKKKKGAKPAKVKSVPQTQTIGG